MKKLITILALITLVFGLSVSSASAWTISIEPLGDFDPAGSTSFTADIYFNADAGGNLLGDYSFALGFDATELAYASSTSTPPPPLSAMFGQSYLNGGEIWNYTGAGFGGAASVTGQTLLGTATFDIIEPVSLVDGFFDVWFVDSAVADQIIVDGVTYQYQDGLPNVEWVAGPDVGAPVPVPAAVWLLGSGLMGIIGIRRRINK